MKRYTYQRLIWYFAGFLLFYAPVALFQRMVALILFHDGRLDVHAACLRCGLLGISGGITMDMFSIRGISIVLLLVTSFIFGPVFCRLFCTAGAITEYLSCVVPDKLKVDWQRHVNPVPVKYGVLTGFLLTPFWGFSVACSYCHYSLFERMTLGAGIFDIGVLSSTNIIILFLWLLLMGALAKGGRGFCSYLCPVGAAQSIMYVIGQKFKFSYKLHLISERCSLCAACTARCPMRALRITNEGLKYEAHNCITCGECINTCSCQALRYGRNNNGRYLNKNDYVSDYLIKRKGNERY